MSRASMNARSPSLDGVVDEQVVDAVGQGPRVERVLERPAPVVEPARHELSVDRHPMVEEGAQRLSRNQRYEGSSTDTVVSPGTDRRATVPPWAVTIASTRERPRPCRPRLPARVRAASPRAKRSKAWSTRSGGKPGPSSWTAKPPGWARDGDRGAGGGVLAGVGQQVGDDLVQPLLVAGDLDRLLGQRQPPLVVGGEHPGVRDRLDQQPGQVHGFADERTAGVEAGQQQQVLHQRGHPAGLLLDLGQGGVGRRRVVGPAAGQLGVAGDRGQRRPQLVGGVGDELPDLLLALVPGVQRRLDVRRASC